MKAKFGFWFFSSAACFAACVMFQFWVNAALFLFVGLSECNLFKYLIQRK